jgi:hypothetical protein
LLLILKTTLQVYLQPNDVLTGYGEQVALLIGQLCTKLSEDFHTGGIIFSITPSPPGQAVGGDGSGTLEKGPGREICNVLRAVGTPRSGGVLKNLYISWPF